MFVADLQSVDYITGIYSYVEKTLSQKGGVCMIIAVWQRSFHSLFYNTAYMNKNIHKHMDVHAYFEGSRPEWCISSMIHSGDTPFWLETLDLLTRTDRQIRQIDR